MNSLALFFSIGGPKQVERSASDENMDNAFSLQELPSDNK